MSQETIPGFAEKVLAELNRLAQGAPGLANAIQMAVLAVERDHWKGLAQQGVEEGDGRDTPNED